MTEDQIKAITEEYAKALEGYGGFGPIEMRTTIVGAIAFLHFLSARYCIVEREKVIEMYNSLKVPNYPCVDPKPTGVARIVLVDLFGTSMFNQNKE